MANIFEDVEPPSKKFPATPLIYIYKLNLAYLVSMVQLHLLADYFTIFIYKAYKWKVQY